MEMVQILRKFLKGERLGIWDLIQAMAEMLPTLLLQDNLYTKSLSVYLQYLVKLSETAPEIFQHFSGGLHVVRRSDHLWAGLSADLVFEQVLMRSKKTTGGLTRGRWMTETQQLIWLMAHPHCAEVNNAMQQLAGINYTTNEQHKDTTNARQERDMADTVSASEDTDLLVLLCFHTTEDSLDIFFIPEGKTGTKKQSRCWNIKHVQKVLGEDVCQNILFTHAILGCDRTSRLYRLGKGLSLKHIRTDVCFRAQAKVFMDGRSTMEDTAKAGESALVSLYKGSAGDTLDKLRLERFQQKVATSAAFDQRTCLLRHLLQSSTASMCISKSKRGKKSQLSISDIRMESSGR
ncbi:hypothetical protein HOLleu_25305 [Holothuria leucospilota]|uniref:Uncharacterized protein n=1 Tax=Holothuria leucospilota TaxID=206669 RepID=A0A9Q1H4F8_HOLLE|nr:hypothetical protein HOLleu_25305 [Holothuria leucospilota]